MGISVLMLAQLNTEYRNFGKKKLGEASLFGKARSWRLLTATDESHQERVEEMVREN